MSYHDIMCNIPSLKEVDQTLKVPPYGFWSGPDTPLRREGLKEGLKGLVQMQRGLKGLVQIQRGLKVVFQKTNT